MFFFLFFFLFTLNSLEIEYMFRLLFCETLPVYSLSLSEAFRHCMNYGRFLMKINESIEFQLFDI